MFNCKHKNQGHKYTRTQKYGEDILIDYTYCLDCKTILSGGVSFIPSLEPQEVSRPTIKKKPAKNKVENKKPKKVKTKSESKVSRKNPTKKSTKKTINKKPRKKDSDIRKNSKKPEQERLPDGVSFGDILKAKYDIKQSKTETQKPKNKTVKKEKSKKVMDDPYSDFFDGADDIETFLK